MAFPSNPPMISGFWSHSSHAKMLIMTVQVAVGKAVHHAIATGDPAVLKKMPFVNIYLMVVYWVFMVV